MPSVWYSWARSKPRPNKRKFVSPDAGANLQIVDRVVDVADQCRCLHAFGIGGLAGDDVDHAVCGVRSPNGSGGAANHLDAIDILQREILHIPVNTGEKRSVDISSIDQDKNRL